MSIHSASGLPRRARRWLVVFSAVGACAASLGLGAGSAAASTTPNESETVTCGSTSNDCFDVSASAVTAGGDATFTSSDDAIAYTFTISDPDTPLDATVGVSVGSPSTTPDLSCTDADGNTTSAPANPVTLDGANFPLSCTATYTASSADIANGYVDASFSVSTDDDTATASGTFAVYETDQVPAVSVAQSDTIDGPASGGDYAAAGESIDYVATVTNTGDAATGSDPNAIADVSVSDSNPSIDYSCPSGTLAVGESESCTARYAVTQSDVDGGPVDSSATATATPTGSGVPIVSGPDDLSLDPSQQPAARLTQAPQAASFGAAARPIAYAENVTNTGNVTLFSPTIANTLNGLLPLRCDLSVIPPGKTAACTQTYLTSPGDVAVGGVANTATMTLETPDATVSSNPATSYVPYSAPSGVAATTYTAPSTVTRPIVTQPSRRKHAAHRSKKHQRHHRHHGKPKKRRHGGKRHRS